MGRIMAVDFGDVRTGVAVSDISKTLVGEAFVIKEPRMEHLAERIVREATERGVEKIILGYPKNMDGSLGERAEKSAQGDTNSVRAPRSYSGTSGATIDAHRISLSPAKTPKNERRPWMPLRRL